MLEAKTVIVTGEFEVKVCHIGADESTPRRFAASRCRWTAAGWRSSRYPVRSEAWRQPRK
jgi:hypothetical protein